MLPLFIIFCVASSLVGMGAVAAIYYSCKKGLQDVIEDRHKAKRVIPSDIHISIEQINDD